jgi:UDP-3-O-[3-hydroxymyristoyl] glucosamine N-acyltransferase
MIDPRFFSAAGPFSVAALSERDGIETRKDELLLSGIASLSRAAPDNLSFFSDSKLQDQLAATQAGAVLVRAEHAALVPSHSVALICGDPYRSMAEITQSFFPQAAQSRPPEGRVGPDNVHPQAILGKNITLEPNVVIGAGAEIGDNCHIGANSFIGHGVVLGRDCTIGANASISYALLGDRVIVHGGANIGCDGFGFAPGAAHVKIPQLGRVILQADVEIGGNTVIDRGALDDTVIGEGSKLDNLVHIAHNVQLGRHCFITASCAIAGSAVLGDYVQMGGGAKITGHVTIGDNCLISANAAVLRSFPADSEIAGSPARLRSELYRDQAFVARQRKRATKDNAQDKAGD